MAELGKLKENSDYMYYHYSSSGIERDEIGDKFTNSRFVSEEKLESSYDSYFIPLYNTAPGFSESFLKLSRTNILNGKMLVSQLFRKALKT